MSADVLAQSLISGLLVGAVYALLSVGFSLGWGVMKVLNIAHAAFALLAAYLAYWILERARLDPLLSLLLIVPLFFLLGVALYQLLIRPVTRAREVAMASMVVTFGLAIIMENTMLYAWKADVRVVKTAYIGASLALGRLSIPLGSLFGSLLSIVAIALLYLFLHRTYTGKAVRATWQDAEGATLMGVDLSRVSAIALGLAIASAGVGGVAMSFIYAFHPPVHLVWLLFVFLVTILGGVGSLPGAAAAGLVIGAILGAAGALMPFAWLNLILFVLLSVILLVRPAGLFRV